MGGYINAYTSRDTTAYYARVLTADTGLALDVISDIVLNPTFDQREIEVERGVILQEIGQSLDTPDDIIFDWLQEAAYPDQAIGRTILGPAERVSSFGRADLSGFVAEHYGPGQMTCRRRRRRSRRYRAAGRRHFRPSDRTPCAHARRCTLARRRDAADQGS